MLAIAAIACAGCQLQLTYTAPGASEPSTLSFGVHADPKTPLASNKTEFARKASVEPETRWQPTPAISRLATIPIPKTRQTPLIETEVIELTSSKQIESEAVQVVRQEELDAPTSPSKTETASKTSSAIRNIVLPISEWRRSESGNVPNLVKTPAPPKLISAPSSRPVQNAKPKSSKSKQSSSGKASKAERKQRKMQRRKQSAEKPAKKKRQGKVKPASAEFIPPPPAPASEDEKPQGGVADNRYPIDLPTVLRLAGAENWNVQLAAERVREAETKLDAAKLAWIPSLIGGVGYTKHDGKIQGTDGNIIDVSRNALFVGGGAATGNPPLAGGSGGPVRLGVDLSLTDAYFKPLVAKQTVTAEQMRQSSTFNDTLLQASLSYYALVAAQGSLTLAHEDVRNAEELLELTKSFVSAGKGSEADLARVKSELLRRRQQKVKAELSVKMSATELSRILRLETGTELVSSDTNAVAVDMIDRSTSLANLIDIGVSQRPEIAELDARTEASRQLVEAERWRPFIPNVHMGASAGGFGGGLNGSLNGLTGRSDFDLLAVWEVRHFGLGTQNLRERSESKLRQSEIGAWKIRDVVKAEVAQAYHATEAAHRQITLAESNVKQALQSYEKNLTRIRSMEGLPIEAVTAMQTVSTSRYDYLRVLIDYNQSQLKLIRAIGGPISDSDSE